ncbi:MULTISPECIES: PLDc N-terminal domain-containing protein [unclassified Rathayibacter]|uniref:PLDc N-terminal domain-containing protein n=1 Tax=unclassified Rathayibacter TaxID=2609250 RepID=UPI00188A036D|nr:MULTISPECIES: PLDc N-terminal domain-containing protein [unclassified Rathayibacter]MBF4463312.1 PLDc N-terminal domain-containing protein [Rathayibacter sp. VKM Ac-2879]MBF4504451.1 PLDc N-terminal domain-containing protein [Rathayibacter sp. VKM Ac-2878]
MIRLVIGLLVALVVFTVYTVIDCALSDRRAVRAIPKWGWLLVVLLLPLIGAALWFWIGRPRKSRDGGRRYTAPDDDPDFLGTLRRDQDPQKEREQAERIAQLERDLADLDEPGEADGPGRRDA